MDRSPAPRADTSAEPADVTRPEPQPPAAGPPRSPVMTKRELLVAAGMVAAGALMTLALLTGRGVPSRAAAAAETSAAVTVSARPSGGSSVATPKWSDANRAVWVGARRTAVAYELEAENTVNIWMRTVRPLLVVRCAAARVEAFVVTHAPARIEPQTEDHTVSFAFDDGGQTEELWPDSEDHDALFAPDGAAFARQLTGARTLRFVFTPHNAPRATARFQVGGLEPLLARSAECGAGK